MLAYHCDCRRRGDGFCACCSGTSEAPLFCACIDVGMLVRTADGWNPRVDSARGTGGRLNMIVLAQQCACAEVLQAFWGPAAAL